MASTTTLRKKLIGALKDYSVENKIEFLPLVNAKMAVNICDVILHNKNRTVYLLFRITDKKSFPIDSLLNRNSKLLNKENDYFKTGVLFHFDDHDKLYYLASDKIPHIIDSIERNTKTINADDLYLACIENDGCYVINKYGKYDFSEII